MWGGGGESVAAPKAAAVPGKAKSGAETWMAPTRAHQLDPTHTTAPS